MGSGAFDEVWPLTNNSCHAPINIPNAYAINDTETRIALCRNVLNLKKCYPKGFATLGESAMLRRQVRRATGKPREHRSPRKIDVTRKLTVVSVSVVTLIRTDTTLDHSQKAEKV